MPCNTRETYNPSKGEASFRYNLSCPYTYSCTPLQTVELIQSIVNVSHVFTNALDRRLSPPSSKHEDEKKK